MLYDPTQAEIRQDAIARRGLSFKEIAALSGFGVSAVRDWSKGARSQETPTLEAIEAVVYPRFRRADDQACAIADSVVYCLCGEEHPAGTHIAKVVIEGRVPRWPAFQCAYELKLEGFDSPSDFPPPVIL